ncbi:hypothetical protein ACFFUT_12715 [Pseudohalocynthiibacter aestuariivivens]|jgi:hypothetical protein|uniref:Roadblock/LC7 domain-containing protein n=1 Tax=Pseudohalocynthiibacter aestuariivivens TaxID=1591409 RepID=A0ABV5JGQ0_9RHOB|nr:MULTISPECIES: hypothetical protein [Pseudohalocynthiibacter]MBS9718131.1 hypothetical protein [Pseudohalocynthiibacter aestuariivivens]MCK0103781.1 hypothetical protein [Pseudohalocynthiibacter sp. F2068]
MNISRQLDTLLQDFPNCETVAFADISTGLVLCSSTRKTMSRGQLDALCAAAIELLNGKQASLASATLDPNGNAKVQEALLMEDGLLNIFVRSSVVSTEALCCICVPEIEIDSFIDRACSELANFDTD